MLSRSWRKISVSDNFWWQNTPEHVFITIIPFIFQSSQVRMGVQCVQRARRHSQSTFMSNLASSYFTVYLVPNRLKKFYRTQKKVSRERGLLTDTKHLTSVFISLVFVPLFTQRWRICFYPPKQATICLHHCYYCTSNPKAWGGCHIYILFPTCYRILSSIFVSDQYPATLGRMEIQRTSY